jgi:hypothetical protein
VAVFVIVAIFYVNANTRPANDLLNLMPH